MARAIPYPWRDHDRSIFTIHGEHCYKLIALTSRNFDFNRAATIKPNLGEVYVNRGAAFVGQHRYKEGLDDINKALELGIGESEKAYYNRALAYEGLDNVKAAYFDYQKAIELKPDWEQPKKELARFSVGRR